MPYISSTTEQFKKKKDQKEFDEISGALTTQNNPGIYIIWAIQTKLDPSDKHYSFFQATMNLTKANLNLYQQIIAPAMLEMYEYTLKGLKSKKADFKKQRKQLFPKGKKKDSAPFASMLKHLSKTQLAALSLMDGEHSHKDQYANFSLHTELDIKQTLKDTYSITDINLIDGLIQYRRAYEPLLIEAVEAERKLDQLAKKSPEENVEFATRWQAIRQLMEDEGSDILAKKTFTQNSPHTFFNALLIKSLADKEAAFDVKLSEFFGKKHHVTSIQSRTSDKPEKMAEDEIHEITPRKKKR